MAKVFISLPNVRAHAHLLAEAGVDHGVGVVVLENHGNKAASRCCMARLVLHVLCCSVICQSPQVPKETRGKLTVNNDPTYELCVI